MIQLSDAAWTAAATVLVAIITPVAAVVMKRSDKAVKTSDQANKTSESTATATHDPTPRCQQWPTRWLTCPTDFAAKSTSCPCSGVGAADYPMG